MDFEARRYKNPIASREEIIAFLNKKKRPTLELELQKAFKTKSPEKKAALNKRLLAMLRDGQIQQNRQKRFSVISDQIAVECFVIRFKEGRAVLKTSQNVTLALSRSHSSYLMVDDLVLVRTTPITYLGYQKAVLIKLIRRSRTTVTGRYYVEKGLSYLRLTCAVMQSDKLSLCKPKKPIKPGKHIVASILPQSNLESKIKGKVLKTISNSSRLEFEIELAVNEFELPHKWVDNIVNKIKSTSLDNDSRVDLRGLPFVTIDGETAKDFDDAIFVEKDKQGWTLWVAIADVTYYVKPGSDLDKEAYKRGCSVYFPNHVIPMLPEILSNDLCSLVPDQDRRVVVAKINMSSNGEVVAYDFMRAWIKSQARLTYQQVADNQVPNKLKVHLANAHLLAEILESIKQNRGAINFSFQETIINFDATGAISKIKPAVKLFAHQLIENFMLLANNAVAKALLEQKIPALYRVHNAPDSSKISSLQESLLALNIPFDININSLEPKDLQRLLENNIMRPDFDLIQSLVLKSLSTAVYQTKNVGHFGLAYKDYTHFTSPIRRYPDIIVHRQIVDYLVAKNPIDFNSDYTKVGQHTSMTERRADAATRKVVDKLKCHYMQSKIGEIYNGTIVSIRNFGMFIRLNDEFIDGMLHVSELVDDYYIHDPVLHQFVGKKSNKFYAVGDSVTIKVKSVNIDLGFIDFAQYTNL